MYRHDNKQRALQSVQSNDKVRVESFVDGSLLGERETFQPCMWGREGRGRICGDMKELESNSCDGSFTYKEGPNTILLFT